jgi:hypothetical protein
MPAALFLIHLVQRTDAVTTTKKLKGERSPMATASQIMRIVADRTDTPFGTIRNIARRLIESGVWPAGTGGYVPQLQSKHVVQLLFALLADGHAKDAARNASEYYDLELADTAEEVCPLGTAGEWVTRLFDMFGSLERHDVESASFAYRHQIEVVCDSPAVRVTMGCNDGTIEYGYLPRGGTNRPWQDKRVRRSMTLPGAVLMRIAWDVAKCGKGMRSQTAQWCEEAERELERMDRAYAI